MSKANFLFLFLGVIFFSCSTSSEDYKDSAKALCECMSENGYESTSAENIKLNIGVCLLDATVDLKNPQLAIEIGAECPELKEGFEEFVSELEE